MKNFYFHVLLILFVITITVLGCKKIDETETTALSANFNVPFGDLVAGNDITFQNTSKNYTSAVWDFGDGTALALNNSTHKYTKSGTYTIKLKVGNDNGENSETTKTVTVLKVPRTGVYMCVSFVGFTRLPQNCIQSISYVVKDSINNIISTTPVYGNICENQLPLAFSANQNCLPGIATPNTLYKIYLRYAASTGFVDKIYDLKPADFYGERNYDNLSIVTINDGNLGLRFGLSWSN